jgi:hypothetical protein
MPCGMVVCTVGREVETRVDRNGSGSGAEGTRLSSWVAPAKSHFWDVWDW